MKSVFLTGASGCIGHYIAETLIEETDYELFLLVRNPSKLQFNYNARPGIHILKGDLRDIEQYSDILLKNVNVAILAATSWGGVGESYDINVLKTIALINLLNPKICEHVIYFSTASILDRNNQPLQQAGLLGTDYIRTKYHCFSQLNKLALAPKITALFPTLVFGGDGNKPLSHISAGLPDALKWIDLIKCFKAEGSFHFIHGKDIAQVVKNLVDNPPTHATRNSIADVLVLGNKPLTVNKAIEEICIYLKKRIYFRIPLSGWLVDLFIKIFRIQMDDWSRFALSYRHFTYQNPVNPTTFGMPCYYPSLKEILKSFGIQPRK